MRTASGATAVQIAQYVRGRQRIVRHLGSAHTEAELGLLIEQARLLLDDHEQQAFAFDVPRSPRRVELVGPPAPAGLFDEPGTPGSAAVPARVGAGRVVGTASRLLFDVLAGVYDRLGFGVVADQTFRDLVICRIVEPTSILDSGRVLTDLGRSPASESTMRRTLGRAHSRGYRDKIATACFDHARAAGDVSLCLYDVTTLYFEAEKEDDLRKVGYSKERRVDPQIIVGLLVDRHGFPLEIGCFEGNKAETHTVVPIVKQFQQRHQLGEIVVVADAGMLSAGNLTDLDEAGCKFIVGSRTTKAPGDLGSHFRWHGTSFADGQIIDTITPRTGRTKGGVSDPALRAEPVWTPDTHPAAWRAVWAYSAARTARDNKTLTLQENRAKAVVAGEKSTRTPRFVTTRNGDVELDAASLARARKLVGLKGYVTNIPAETISPAGVITNYHDLCHVEQSFRMSKTDLRARPMFHHTRDAIEAHLTIVFTALAVSRHVQNLTGLAIRNVIRQLRPLRSATIQINDAVQTLPPAVPADQQPLIDALTQAVPDHALND